LGLFGYFAISIAILVVSLLSRRLGAVTHARRYYLGMYFSAVLIWLGIVARVFFLTTPMASFQNLNQNTMYVLLCDGLPALAITLALLITWYYWSWLLAERD
jgi:hypothetical protein